LVNGVEYRERSLQWWHSNLGIVLQQPQLFSGTIAENIRYGRLDSTQEEIEEAAQLVGAHDFVMELEKNYETEVGEGGNQLSLGQKQLVSFARAVLKRPRLLIMDEATSSIDTETELQIQQGLTRVLKGRTSFVIAHRLSTIRAADRILVIDKGQIIEQGTHNDLLRANGRYHSLYTEQSMRDIVRIDNAI
jgi:ATP-binding cassette subfamily B protein